MLNKLKNSYLVVPIAIVIVIFLMFLSEKFSSAEDSEGASKSVYIKASLIVAVISAGIVFLNSPENNNLFDDSDIIMKGPPPF